MSCFDESESNNEEKTSFGFYKSFSSKSSGGYTSSSFLARESPSKKDSMIRETSVKLASDNLGSQSWSNYTGGRYGIRKHEN